MPVRPLVFNLKRGRACISHHQLYRNKTKERKNECTMKEERKVCRFKGGFLIFSLKKHKEQRTEIKRKNEVDFPK